MGVGAIFFLFALFCIPTIVFNPEKFTSCFTIAMLSFLIAIAFLTGPKTYLKKLTKKENLIKTGALFGSMILSLYFSIISSSYLLSIIFCIIEVKLIFYINLIFIVKCSSSVFLWSIPSRNNGHENGWWWYGWFHRFSNQMKYNY